MKKMFVWACTALVLAACDKNNNNAMTSKNDADNKFMMGVAMSNTAEVAMGQMAATKGTNPQVVSFGQMMVMHHTMAQTMLKALGDSVQARVVDSISADKQMLQQRLSMLSGYSFDTAYMNSQVMGHQETLNIFQNEIGGGFNTYIHNFALRNVGMIQMHYMLADSIRRRL